MYDIIIIGAGTAGISAYKEAIKHTQNIFIINDGPWDTTCARVGCMPSKVLISVANRMHDIQHADEVALELNAKVNTDQVMPHVRQLRDRFTRATLKDINQWDPTHKISGKAEFVNAQTVRVGKNNYHAKSFIVAVGSTPSFDPLWKEELGDLLITSDQIFELEKLPKRLAVIGSGVIAIELAQAMQRLGVETTVFARSQKVGSLSSPNLQDIAQKTLGQSLNIKFKVLPETIKKFRNKVKLSFTENKKNESMIFDYLLVATGRTSYLNSLKLENIDSTYADLKQLPVHNQTKQLGSHPIYIIGDAYTNTPVQHEAAHEGKHTVQNCLNYPKVKNIKTLTPLGIMFSSPEMATVGQSYKHLQDQEIQFVTGFINYEKQGRAIVLGKSQGAAEIYIDRTSRQILGAELFVDDAEHLAHLLGWMITQKMTVDEVLMQPFYHPTLEEGLRTALKHARRQIDNITE